MMMKKDSSDLRVAVVFGPDGRIRPVWFDFHRRRHDIRTITNSWRDRRGEIIQLHFHVTDEGALFELTFNLSTVKWHLVHLEAL